MNNNKDNGICLVGSIARPYGHVFNSHLPSFFCQAQLIYTVGPIRLPSHSYPLYTTFAVFIVTVWRMKYDRGYV